MKDFPLARHAPHDYLLDPDGQPLPGGPRAPRRVPKRGRTEQRGMAFGASVGLHLGVLLIFFAWPQPSAPAKAAEKAPDPIEVSLLETPMVSAPVAAPGPKREQPPRPVPKAPEEPAKPIERAQAAAPKPLPPKPAVRAAKPAPVPARKAVTPPKAPDLQAALEARFNQGREQAEQRLAALQADARTGDPAAAAPGAGTPQGDPTVDASGLSGALASRAPLHRVNPAYPPEEERRGDEGTVIVKLYVRADGAVSRTEVVRSSGRGSFDRAALAAARQWRFTPLDDPAGPEQFGSLPFRFYLR